MKLSIVIPAYNEEAYIEDCLRSIEQYGNNISEVIVVDNGSTDNTRAIAQKFSFVQILSEPRKGVAFARQLGLRHAAGDLVAFLDADSQITKGWADIPFQVFREEKVVALSGPAWITDFRPFYTFLVKLYYGLAISFAWLTGTVILLGNLVVRKSAILSVGGIDTSVVFYGDDTNLARRLHTAGKIIFRNDFRINTSSRRLRKQGIMKTAFIYVLNHLSELFFHRPVTKNYLDIR